MNRLFAMAAAGIVTSAVLAGTPATAQAELDLPAPDVTPTSGPIGTTITVSGDGCVHPWREEPGEAIVSFRKSVETPSGESLDLPMATVTSPTVDGRWTAQLTVPASATGPFGIVLDAEPGVGYLVTATCDVVYSLGSGPIRDSFAYEPVPFEVTGDADAAGEDPPAQPATGSAVDTTTPPVTPVAQPAMPIAGDPSYTG